ncbi:MAG: 4-(cytidine 5'-diphospho)-2-C-methyl-D-erythritol kinase, partial [Rhodobacteraceae bacterium]|nr:4-(cytidine 5'-diphospho)-2-C-methyl-D-erythritol kinase [Paracoccaceae bacterium]
VLESLSSAPLARMSGSGATCFALFETREEAEKLANALRSARPEWWIAATRLLP